MMKQTEIEKLLLEDLHDKLVAYKKQLLSMLMAHAVTPLDNPLQIRNIRRTIARLLTAISEREQETKLEDGN